MKKAKKTALILATIISVNINTAFAKDSVEGLWLTENKRAVINIEKCEDSICGKIHWIIEGGLQRDIHNEDPALKNQPMCGLKILGDFKEDSPNTWEDGFIYKADDGDTYSANIELKDDGTLKLRGYVGFSFLGKTQIWTRANEEDYKVCSAPTKQ